jgi:uncharacterized membrane protein
MRNSFRASSDLVVMGTLPVAAVGDVDPVLALLQAVHTVVVNARIAAKAKRTALLEHIGLSPADFAWYQRVHAPTGIDQA